MKVQTRNGAGIASGSPLCISFGAMPPTGGLGQSTPMHDSTPVKKFRGTLENYFQESPVSKSASPGTGSVNVEDSVALTYAASSLASANPLNPEPFQSPDVTVTGQTGSSACRCHSVGHSDSCARTGSPEAESAGGVPETTRGTRQADGCVGTVVDATVDATRVGAPAHIPFERCQLQCRLFFVGREGQGHDRL